MHIPFDAEVFIPWDEVDPALCIVCTEVDTTLAVKSGCWELLVILVVSSVVEMYFGVGSVVNCGGLLLGDVGSCSGFVVVRGDWTSLTVVVAVAIATKKKILYSEFEINDKTSV